MKKKATATWSIELNLTCPYKSCDSWLNLLDSDQFPALNDDGGFLRFFEPAKNYNMNDSELKYLDSITCPECEREIRLDEITW